MTLREEEEKEKRREEGALRTKGANRREAQMPAERLREREKKKVNDYDLKMRIYFHTK